MAFSSGANKGPMADINVTPLVDVMLVLLIIFIVTAPIMTYPIEVALPQRVINPPPSCVNRRRRSTCGSMRRAKSSGTTGRSASPRCRA